MQLLDKTESGNIILGEEIFRYTGTSDGVMVYQSNDVLAYLEPAESAEEALRADAFIKSEARRDLEEKCGADRFCFPVVMEERDEAGDAHYFFFTVMPKGQKADSGTVSLAGAVLKKEFDIYPRVLAAIHLCDAVTVMAEQFGSNFRSIHPEDILINTENGQVYLVIRKWLEPVPENANSFFGASPELLSGKKVPDSTDVSWFLSYAVFRLILGEDPFDGEDAMLKYPLMMEEARREIETGKYGFLFASGSNRPFRYGERKVVAVWNALPAEFRRNMTCQFTEALSDPQKRMVPEAWLTVARKLRDSLISAGGKMQFCDYEKKDGRQYLSVGEYHIPVWPKKGVYWYHFGNQRKTEQNGVTAGIIHEGEKYYLQNFSDSTWAAVMNGTAYFVNSGERTELAEGLVIRTKEGQDLVVESAKPAAVQ